MEFLNALTDNVIVLGFASLLVIYARALGDRMNHPAAVEGEPLEAVPAKTERYQPKTVDCIVPFIRRRKQEAIALAELGIRELKKIASERRITGYYKMRKSELIAALSA